MRSRIIQHVKAVLHLFGVIDDQGSKEPVPDRENIAKIAICPRSLKMMVKLMHIGSDEYQTHRLVNPNGSSDIGMGRIGKYYGHYTVEEII